MAVTKIAIKRMCFEWLTIGLASATVSLFALWSLSLVSDRADFVIQWGQRKELSTEGGACTFKKGIDNLDWFNLCRKVWSPGTATFSARDFPGVTVRNIRQGDYWSGRWFIRFSLLIPTLMLAALTVGCYLGHRRAWKRWQAELAEKAWQPATKEEQAAEDLSETQE